MHISGTWPAASRSGRRSSTNSMACRGFSPDGKTFLTGCEATEQFVLGTLPCATSKGAVMHHQGWVVAVAFIRDGKLILTGSQDQTARLWEAGTGKPLGDPLVHQGDVKAVAFAPDGNTIVTGVNVNVVQRRTWPCTNPSANRSCTRTM